MFRPTILALTLLATATSVASAQSDRPARQSRFDVAALREMAPDRLYALGWESERLDLDFATAIAAYSELVLRKDADLRRRIRGYDRLQHILIRSARFDPLLAITQELARDDGIPARYRSRIQAIAKILERDGPRARRLFQAEYERFKEKRRKRGQKARSHDRDVLRRAFLRDLRAASRDLNTTLRQDVAARRSPFRGSGSAGGGRPSRAKQLRDALIRLGRELREVESRSGRDSAEWRRLDGQRRSVETQLRAVLRRQNSTPSERRLMSQLRDLESRIEQLDRAGKHDQADRLIDEAEGIRDRLPRELRRRFWTLGRALANPVARRRALREIQEQLPRLRSRLDDGAHRTQLAAVTAYEQKLSAFIRAKRWREGAQLTRALSERNHWFPRVWRAIVRDGRPTDRR